MYQFHFQLTLIEERGERARSTDKNRTKPWTNPVVPLPAANLAQQILGGGSGAWLALLGLNRGRAANALICALRLLLRAKVRDDSSPLFARCALLGFWGRRQWRLGGMRPCNWRCCWGEALGGVGPATDDAIIGRSIGGVEDQGTDDAVIDRGNK